MVSGIRQLAPVSGARNRRWKQAPENGQCVINFTVTLLFDFNVYLLELSRR